MIRLSYSGTRQVVSQRPMTPTGWTPDVQPWPANAVSFLGDAIENGDSGAPYYFYVFVLKDGVTYWYPVGFADTDPPFTQQYEAYINSFRQPDGTWAQGWAWNFNGRPIVFDKVSSADLGDWLADH